MASKSGGGVLLAIVALAAIGFANSDGDGPGTDDLPDASEDDRDGEPCDGVVIVQDASGSATVPGAETLVESSVECTIAEGSGDEDAVEALQQALVTCNGQAVDVDGEYGPRTSQAVAQVEEQNGLAADGVYDSRTREVMRWPVTSASGTTCVDGG